ncbi:MAG: diaminopimelate epimerase [Acidimicrobiia bacterium]|nr:diaminopimelate epimerase [Acidimicrobiia bacterium]
MSHGVPVGLTKHHGLGNDFLVALDPEREIGSPEAKKWCDRRTGIGADGLIVATIDTSGERRRSEWTMVLWNADGSRAEISGNGIRCLGQAIGQRMMDAGPIPMGAVLFVDTDAGRRQLTLYPGPYRAGSTPDVDTWQVRVGMGPAGPGPSPSPAWVDAGLQPSHQQGVDIGNPHLVAIVDVDQFDKADMAVVGPIIEAGYPTGINVHLVNVVDRQTLELKVWERGAGVTQACGSGACAAAWAAHQQGLVGTEITVTMPGGSASVELTDDDVYLIGPATFVGSVRIA